MITHTMVDFLGAGAGAFAISLAIYLRFIAQKSYPILGIAGLYIIGIILVSVNIDPFLVDTGYHRYVRLVLYLTIIILEIGILYVSRLGPE